MSKKSCNRLESKKKKAAAFIRLINSDENYLKSKEEESKSQNKGSRPSSDGNKQSTSSGEQRSLSDEMFAEYKKMMRERQNAAMLRPKVFLTIDELIRDDPIQTDIGEVKVAPPLFMADVQHLLLYALQGKDASVKPRWCRLLRVGKVNKVVAVVLDSLSSEEFKKYPESLPTLVQAFDMHVDMISPLQYGSSAREDIMNVPISITQLRKRGLLAGKKCPNKSNKQEVRKNPNSQINRQLWATAKQLKSLAENPLETFDKEVLGHKRKRPDYDSNDNDSKRIKTEDEQPYGDVVSTYEMDNYDRRWLMLNTAQMIYENIPIPINAGNDRYRGYVFSKREYKEVTDKSPIFAVDCEMVRTKVSSMDLARVSFIDENLEVVYDSYVKPWAPVVDYVTRFSGITKEILDPVTTRLEDVQRIVQKCLPPDAILCGQSIGGDLASMKIFHPYIIDTSVIFNLTGNRRIKPGLRRLSSVFLRKGIQESSQGHDSVEDAQTTMELVLLKLRNNIEFGDIAMVEADLTDCANDSAVNSSDDVNKGDNNDDKSEEDTESRIKNTDITDTGDTTSARKLTEKNCDDSVMETDNGNRENTNLTPVIGSRNKHTENTTGAVNVSSDTSVNSAVTECSGLTRTLISHGQDNSGILKRRLFFQNEGSKFIENFIHRIENNRLQKRQGAIIDEPNSVNLYPKSLSVITCKKDKDSERQTVDKIKNVGFCFTHLYGFKNHLEKSQGTSQSENQMNERQETDQSDEEVTKKCLWKLDRRFWKIMMELPSNSLFVVILPGREENGNIHSAMTFAKIT